jgi:tryptophanyl-tRNA synthetase
MAASFNHRYGEHFVPPQAEIEESVATLPGLDGRKMSKSYDNTIPLFSSREQLKKLIAGIKTDSRAPGEPKDTEGSALFQIYQAFASEVETEALRTSFAEGIAWGDAKTILFERIDREIAPMRAAYEDYMAHPEKVEALLLSGAQKARAIATPFMTQLRSAVGLRRLSTMAQAGAVKAEKVALAAFKQYREKDGQFYFKLAASDGALLLQSKAFASGKDAGQTITKLQREGAAGLSSVTSVLEPMDAAGIATASVALDALAAAAAEAAKEKTAKSQA